MDYGVKVNAKKDDQDCFTSPTQYTQHRDTFGLPVSIPDPSTGYTSCEQKKDHLRTPLHLAIGCKNPDIKIVKFLLDHGKRNPLYLATRNNCGVDVIILLLEHGADFMDALEMLLSGSQIKSSMPTVTVLLNHWAKLSTENRKNSHVLSKIADNWGLPMRDKVQIIKFLLEKGADPNKKNESHETPFALYAAFQLDSEPYLEGLKLFVDHGANVNLVYEGKTPLDWISGEDGTHEAVKFLRSKGALTIDELSSKKSSKDEF